MELRVNDYVRTRWGCIAKFEGIHEGFYEFDNIIMDESSAVRKELFVDIVEKSSPNIIDLIEVGDYVNGLPVGSVNGTRFDENDLRVWLAVATKYVKEYGVENSDGDYEFDTLYRCIKPENIKSIVTKEQFESMEYKIGE